MFFVRAFGLPVVHLSFLKKEKHLITFRIVVAKTQINFVFRKGDRTLFKDCKVLPSENILTRHKFLVIDLVSGWT